MLQIVALAGGADRLRARPEVLDDLVGAALHGEQRAEVRDDVLRRRPAGELAGEVDADELADAAPPTAARPSPRRSRRRRRRWPACRGRRAFGVCESAPIISAARERVVLQHDLVDDAGARAARSRCRTCAPPSGGSCRPPRSRGSRAARSSAAPDSARIRWSQCSDDGTATRLRPDIMNWKSAICPVTSCSATRSTRSRGSPCRAPTPGASKSQQWRGEDLLGEGERPAEGAGERGRCGRAWRRRAGGRARRTSEPPSFRGHKSASLTAREEGVVNDELL